MEQIFGKKLLAKDLATASKYSEMVSAERAERKHSALYPISQEKPQPTKLTYSADEVREAAGVGCSGQQS